jgi:hypothetical protein
MQAYQPPALFDSTSDPEMPAPASTSVAPLVQFFELVHVGDMIQSIVQAYFDKELVWTTILRFTSLSLKLNLPDIAVGPPR